jgi:hypothetical protein
LIRLDEKRPARAAPESDAGTAGRRRPTGGDRSGNTMVLATIASVAAATAIGAAVLSPFLFTAAVFPFYYRALLRSDHRAGIVLVFRWGFALFVSLVVVGAFLPDRLGAALPFSSDAVGTIAAWIRDPQAPPPADIDYILWGMLAFLAASAASGGLAGFVVAAAAIGAAAFGAVFVFRHGLNLIQIALVALPVWQLSSFIAAAFFLVPASVLVFAKFFRVEVRIEEWQRLRRYMYAGAGFLALGILLRYATAGVWRSLIERWTIR